MNLIINLESIIERLHVWAFVCVILLYVCDPEYIYYLESVLNVSSSEVIDKLFYVLACEYLIQIFTCFFFISLSRFRSQPDLSNTPFIINRFKFKSLFLKISLFNYSYIYKLLLLIFLLYCLAKHWNNSIKFEASFD